MRISLKYKFIFLSNAKTGSESMRAILNPYSDIRSTQTSSQKYYHHSHVKKLLLDLEKDNYDYKEFFIFGFIRNPWDRAVSMFIYSQHDKNFNPFWSKDHDKKSIYTHSFNKWINYCKMNNKNAFVTIDYFYSDRNGNIIPNKIYKMEEMDKAIKDINKKCNINIKNIIHINKSPINRKHYSFYYNKESYYFIKETMKKDIEYGNYSFENFNKDLTI